MRLPLDTSHQQKDYAAMALAMGLFLLAITRNVADPDLFGYLAFGRLFFESPSFPYEDAFSYYPVKDAWVYHEWLTGVLFFKIHSLMGPWALQALKYVLALSMAAGMWKVASVNGASGKSKAICLLMACWVLAQGWSPVRAQAFTYCFFALALLALEHAHHKGNYKVLWLLPPLFWLWSNLHGGFLAGMGLVGLYSLGWAIEGMRAPRGERKAARLGTAWLVLAACILATLINPYGFSYWEYLARSVFMHRPFIVEWWPLHRTLIYGFFLPASLIFLAMVLCLILALPRVFRTHPIAGIMLVGLAIMGFLHHRHGVFFAIGFGACMPAYLEWEKRDRQGQSFTQWFRKGMFILAATASGLLCLYQFFFLHTGSPLALRAPSIKDAPYGAMYYPAGAVEYLKEYNIQGNILTVFHWGEYIMWRMYPESKIAVDGRYETVYPEGLIHEHFLAFENPQVRAGDFFAYMDKYPTEIVIAETGSTAHRFLWEAREWRQDYMDEGCVILRKIRGDQSLDR